MSIKWNRREFVRASAATSLVLPLSQSVFDLLSPREPAIRFGVIADLHQDVMHDAPRRMDIFLEAMQEEKPDAILQLGDFAYPNAKNQPLVKTFNEAGHPTIHVLGNHDMDDGHTRQQCVDVWGMPGFYAAHQVKGLTLLVLDGNDKDSPTHQGGYARFVGPEQVEWLEAQLTGATQPVIVISHQPLAGPSAVDNAQEMQDLLGRHADKILFAMNGHTHMDYLTKVQDVLYWHVNSASYHWVGGNHIHSSYPEAIHEKHPYIAYTCPYRDPLYATITIDPAAKQVRIAGSESEWVGSTPAELDVKAIAHPDYNPVVPRIRKQSFDWTGKPTGK
ncbi:MAG: metallophosphoesterase [Mariniblastus sp.]|nr:metallophosphoesterase [Mariniblastus sp.]